MEIKFNEYQGSFRQVFGMSELDIRLWIYSSPFVGLALYFATINPHDDAWRVINHLMPLMIFLIYFVPLLLPIRRFIVVPTGFFLFLIVTLIYHPIFTAAVGEISFRESFEFRRISYMILAVGNELIIPLILVTLKSIFLTWLNSRKPEEHTNEVKSSSSSAPNSSN